VDIVLLALADLVGVYGHTLPQDVLQKHLDIARTMLEAYWETPQQVTPDLLLNGSEMMDVFQLEPGPKIGELLEVLREAQAVGAVETREQAIRFLTDTLADS
jgi:poly(A) polymerase